jgi:hypothetical protein
MGRFGLVRRISLADVLYEDRRGQPYRNRERLSGPSAHPDGGMVDPARHIRRGRSFAIWCILRVRWPLPRVQGVRHCGARFVRSCPGARQSASLSLILLFSGPRASAVAVDSRRLRYRSRLTRLPSRCGFGNFYKFSRFHIVDVTVNRNIIGNQRVISNTRDIFDDALGVLRKC